MDLIVNFIRHDKLPEDKKDAQTPDKGSKVLDLPHWGLVQKIVYGTRPNVRPPKPSLRCTF